MCKLKSKNKLSDDDINILKLRNKFYEEIIEEITIEIDDGIKLRTSISERLLKIKESLGITKNDMMLAELERLHKKYGLLLIASKSYSERMDILLEKRKSMYAIGLGWDDKSFQRFMNKLHTVNQRNKNEIKSRNYNCKT